ncbi:MAG: hypothetical protein KAJ10_11050 [Thermodesulfovibrionia bacterium]|nr:hypothetical protein [Thermodesulfovibrionia bacterium]
MKRFTLFQITFAVMILFFIFSAIPAIGGELPGRDGGVAIADINHETDLLLASVSSSDIAFTKFEQRPQFIIGMEWPDEINLITYQMPFIVQKGSGIASVRYGKARARAPDIGLILAASKNKMTSDYISRYHVIPCCGRDSPFIS